MRIRPILLALMLAALAGCKREPDFDQRYKAASTRISQSAHEIDAQVSGTGVPVEEEEK